MNPNPSQSSEIRNLGERITNATLDCMNGLTPEGRAAMADQLREVVASAPGVRIEDRCLCPPHQIDNNFNCPFHGRRRH